MPCRRGRPAVSSVHRERHQQAQGATIRAAAAGQDVASRKLILRAFAAKLIADPDGGSKPAGKPAGLPVPEAVENAVLIDAGAAGRARDG